MPGPALAQTATQQPGLARACSPPTLPHASNDLPGDAQLGWGPGAWAGRTAYLARDSLGVLSESAYHLASAHSAVVGVAVAVPGHGVVYSANGFEPFRTASVAKVAIMITLLDRVVREERDLTARQRALLERMITLSDNDAANVLWAEAGGAVAIGDYLCSIGLATVQPDPDGYWGYSSASADDLALLLAKLAEGEILDPPRRALALDLMSRVAPWQRWGVLAAARHEPPSSLVGTKGGWQEMNCGWWVNSAGFVVPSDGRPAYTVAVLTRRQPSRQDGERLIEAIADRVHTSLFAGALPDVAIEPVSEPRTDRCEERLER